MKKIKFYRTGDEYGEFSNFSKHPIMLKGYIWKTVEHYFQSEKFDDYLVKDKIRDLKSPMEAAIEGRNKNNSLKTNWESLKEDVMFEALKAKFTQHNSLKKLLLSTEDSIIVEHTVNDSYWGNGGDGSGLNRLGELLMKTREYIHKIHSDKDLIFPPWIAFPNVEENDLFWRMGLGEDYLLVWANYYNQINKEEYHKIFPVPETWKDIFE
ncbi:NADAR family protein [Algibacter sp. 2305UL17-15]|uniref:NADAR family protein n=1 Tax=Algibacter sp. 2305UL17-15 TaxID=3231268 RepID=UPI0034584152